MIIFRPSCFLTIVRVYQGELARPETALDHRKDVECSRLCMACAEKAAGDPDWNRKKAKWVTAGKNSDGGQSFGKEKA